MTAPEDRPDDEIRAQATLLMAMVDSGKARIEPTDPDDGVGVAWIRVMDAAAIAAARLAAVERERDRWREAADAMTRVLSTNHSLTYVPTAILDRVSEARAAALSAAPQPQPGADNTRVPVTEYQRQPQPARAFCVTCGNLHATAAHEQCAANEARGLHADGVDPARCEHGVTSAHFLPLDRKPVTGGCPGPQS